MGKRGCVRNIENRLYAGNLFPTPPVCDGQIIMEKTGETIEYFCSGHQLEKCEEMASQTGAYEFEKNRIKNSTDF